MMNKNIFCVGFASIVLLLNVNINAQQKLSIKEAISIALKNNYDILVAKGDMEISGNNYSLGNAGLLPKVDVSGSVTKTVNNTKQEFSDGTSSENSDVTSNYMSGGISLSWTLFDGMKMFISLSKLKELQELGQIKLRTQIESSISDVIRTYFDIVKQKYNFQVAKEAIAVSEERTRITEEKFTVGSASKLDVLRAKADLNADKSNLLTQEAALNSLKTYLNGLLARSIADDFDVDEGMDIKEGLLYNKLKEAAFTNNSEILQAEKNKAAASYDIDFTRGDYFPKITFNTGYNYSNTGYPNGSQTRYTSNGYNYGLSLSWNLFNGFNTQLQYQNAIISLDKNELRLLQAKSNVEANLLIAYKNYTKNLEILKLEEENVTISKENLDLAIEQLKLGSLSPIEFRDVQRNYVTAQSRLSTAMFNAKMSERDLLKQSGALIQ